MKKIKFDPNGDNCHELAMAIVVERIRNDVHWTQHDLSGEGFDRYADYIGDSNEGKQKLLSLIPHALLNHFRGRRVKIGTSRNNRPAVSIGSWLHLNGIKTAIASYIGPILLHEGYAERGVGGTDLIQFN